MTAIEIECRTEWSEAEHWHRVAQVVPKAPNCDGNAALAVVYFMASGVALLLYFSGLRFEGFAGFVGIGAAGAGAGLMLLATTRRVIWANQLTRSLRVGRRIAS